MVTVSIILDTPHAVFTNLDEIAGRVILRLNGNTAVTSIAVKLEGESKTRLADPQDRKRATLEVHKILYKVEGVFPPQQLQEGPQTPKSFTLNAGNHEYPFRFKIPFNNSCDQTPNPSGGVFGELATPIHQPIPHVKATLPPSLSGFPGEADISYFIKVTVKRPQFYLENARAVHYFTFLPIEPPSQMKDGESYARRQHQFTRRHSGFEKTKTGLFSRKSTFTPIPGPDKTEPPARFSADIRLPNPAILTCNKSLPLKVLIKKLGTSTEQLYLQSLQVELIGYTHVRAQWLDRTESSSWVVFSQSSMGVPIGSPADGEGTEHFLPEHYWADKPLPNTVSPSFQTCNISRRYELQVMVGLGYATPQSGQDQFVVLPLRLAVQVYSGIHPPKELLAAMTNPSSAQIPPRKPPRPTDVKHGLATSTTPTSPMAPGPAAVDTSDPAPMYEDAPPSYEDAVAGNMAPVQGPRGDYAPPPSGGEDARFRDQKRA